MMMVITELGRMRIVNGDVMLVVMIVMSRDDDDGDDGDHTGDQYGRGKEGPCAGDDGASHMRDEI